VSGLENLFSRTITLVLILHPIACVLTFIALIISISNIWRRKKLSGRLPYLISLGAILLAAFITTIAFLVDVTFVAVIRKKLSNDTDGDLSLNYGNAVWMTVAAALTLWFATAAACTDVFACGWRHRKVASA
jgi:uncharacterized membrane protein YozB (DUF420 family)